MSRAGALNRKELKRTMNAKQVSDAKRLAVTLDQYADDPTTVKKLAAALHYMPEQLREDMRTLYEYLRELEELNQTEDE